MGTGNEDISLEQQLSNAFYFAPIGVALIGIDGHFLKVNNSLTKILGYSEGELLATDFQSITFPEDLPKNLEYLTRLIEGEIATYQFEKRYIHKQGHALWVLISVSLVRDLNGEPLYMISHTQDISKRRAIEEELRSYREELQKQVTDRTEKLLRVNEDLRREILQRLQAENAIKSSEAVYRELFDNISSGVAVFEVRDYAEKFIIKDFNRAAERIDKLTKEDVLGKELEEIYPGIKEFGLLAVLKRVWQTGKAEYFSESFYKDRRISGWRENYVYRLPSGEVVAVFNDITERKKVERKLKESEEHYRWLVEFSPNAVLVYLRGKIAFANQEAAKLLEVSDPLELTGKKILDYLHPENRHLGRNIFKKFRSSKAFPQQELKLILPDGKVKEVSVLSRPFLFRGRQAVQIVCRDITGDKQKELEYQRIEKLEAMGVLAGGIAHDFNNILTIILGNTSLARLCAKEEQKVFEKLSSIEKAVQQAKYLTNQLLTFSRGGDPVKEIVSLRELLREAVDLALSGSNVMADFQFAEEIWPVEIDWGQAAQVINNLVINAVQAMPGGGAIHVNLENCIIEKTADRPQRPGKYVKLTIRDEGIGIPQKYLNKIFDPYFTTKQKGSGLGLTTTFSIVQKHGGYIAVASEPGAGTTFEIYWPASPLKKPASPGENKKHHGKGKILFMDDQEEIREIAGQMLAGLGYEATLAADGMEAVKLFREELQNNRPFDLLITDLTVPGGMGGREAAAGIREFYPRLKAVVSSGYFNDPVLANYKNYGFDGVIVKPYEMEKLGEVIGKVLPEE